MDKKNLDLVFISAGYIEDSSLSHMIFVLETEKRLVDVDIAKKFVKDVTDLYKEEHKEMLLSDCCEKSKALSNNFCPECGRDLQVSEDEEFDFEGFFRNEITATVDASCHFWWQSALEDRGWYIWRHDMGDMPIRRIVTISCVEAAAKANDVRLDASVTFLD